MAKLVLAFIVVFVMMYTFRYLLDYFTKREVKTISYRVVTTVIATMVIIAAAVGLERISG